MKRGEQHWEHREREHPYSDRCPCVVPHQVLDGWALFSSRRDCRRRAPGRAFCVLERSVPVEARKRSSERMCFMIGLGRARLHEPPETHLKDQGAIPWRPPSSMTARRLHCRDDLCLRPRPYVCGVTGERLSTSMTRTLWGRRPLHFLIGIFPEPSCGQVSQAS